MAKKLMKAQMGKIVKAVAKKTAPMLNKKTAAGVGAAIYGPAAAGAGIAAYQKKKSSAKSPLANKKMGGQGSANKIGKMVKISKKMK